MRPSVGFFGSLPLLIAALGCGSAAPANVSGPALDAGSPDAAQDAALGPVTLTFVDSSGHEVLTQFIHEAVELKLSGLAAGARVTVTASTSGGGYVSHAVFQADANGDVSTKGEAPIEGTYASVDEDGLLWSMALGDPSKRIINDPNLDVHATVDGNEVAQGTLTRQWWSPDLVTTKVSDNGLVGVFITPKTGGPHPVILAFGGSEGGLGTGGIYASFLASQGYAALGLAYFADTGLPATLSAVPLEYFGKAIAWVKQRPEIIPTRIGVMGASRGGELALLLGANFPDLSVVIAQVPSGLVWPSTTGVGSAWTLGGQPVPFVSEFGVPTTTTNTTGDTVYHTTPAFLDGMAAASPQEIDAATTRVERTMGAILMLAGGDDQLWPSCPLSKIAMDRLVVAHHDTKYGDELHCYAGAGHFLSPTWAGLPTTLPQEVPIDGALYALGGVPDGLGHGDRDAYEVTKAFLKRAWP